MKKTISTIISFVAGVAVGGLVSYRYLEKKFTDRLDVELAELKKIYNEKACQAKADFLKNKPAVSELVNDIPADKINEKPEEDDKEYKNYTAYYKNDTNAGKSDEAPAVEEIPAVNRPYVITPDDFGSMGYNEISLTYYADGILTEEDDNKKLSIKKTIGKGNIKHMGEYAQDALYIRNEEREIDYEIIKDNRTYAEVYGDIAEEE